MFREIHPQVTSGVFVWLLLPVFLSGFLSTASADLEWEEPDNDYINIRGFVDYSVPIGGIVFDGKICPIILNFESRGRIRSDYLPVGWSIPLIDAHSVESQESVYRAVLPDGSIFGFEMAADGKPLSEAFWDVELQNQQVTLKSFDDSSFVVFHPTGRIARYQSAGGDGLTWNYDEKGRLVDLVSHEGRKIVGVETQNSKLLLHFTDRPPTILRSYFRKLDQSSQILGLNIWLC